MIKNVFYNINRYKNSFFVFVFSFLFVLIGFLAVKAQVAPVWNNPSNNSIVSGAVSLSVNADQNSIWVKWCYSQGTNCDPSVNGTNMSYDTAQQLWTSIWDTAQVSDGSYNLCAVSFDGNPSNPSCISVTVQNNANNTGQGSGSGNVLYGLDGKTFQQRKTEWLNREGKTYDGRFTNIPQYGNSFLFAWFEKGLYFGDTGPGDINPNKYSGVGSAHVELQKLFGSDWNAAGSLAQLTGARLFFQYGDVLQGKKAVNGNYYKYTTDYDDLNNELRNQVRQYGGLTARLGGPGSCSTQPTRTIVSYVYTLTDPNATFTYKSLDPNNPLPDWTGPYTGILYSEGNTYNSYKYTLDLLYNGFDKCFIDGNNTELEGGHYTWTSIIGYMFLYDFADRVCSTDPNSSYCLEGKEVKKKAKMTLDFLVLSEMMDFSAKQFGGSYGRTYRRQILDGVQRFGLHNVWFGLPEKSPREAHGLAYVSTYIPSELIFNLVTSPETDGINFWRWNTKNVKGVANQQGQTGKWVFVTPNFNLGGSDTNTPGWILNIKSSVAGQDDYINRTGQPFRLWVDRLSYTGNRCNEYITSNCNKVWGLGGSTYKQFRNAVFLNDSRLRLHVVQQNDFDEGQSNLVPLNENDAQYCPGQVCENNYTLNSGWNFFREGDVAIAMIMSGNAFGMEVVSLTPGCSELHCYGNGNTVAQNFSDFKNAVINNASITQTSFTTSKGYTISLYDKSCGLYAPGDCVFPFDRLESVDNAKNKNIDWNNKIMTVSKSNLNCTYDFNNWTYTGNGCPNSSQSGTPGGGSGGGNGSGGGTSPGAVCGDNICQTGIEGSNTCPSDCGTYENNMPPYVQITATPSSGEAVLDVAFSSTSFPDTDLVPIDVSQNPESCYTPDINAPDYYTTDCIREYIWDFGDGSNPVTTRNSNINHKYIRAGVYTAKVVAVDKFGAKNEATVTITVTSANSGGGSGNAPDVCMGVAGEGGDHTPDINSDGCVDDRDLSMMYSCWGVTESNAPSVCLIGGSTGNNTTPGNGTTPPNGSPPSAKIIGDYPLIGWQTFTGAVDDFYSRFDLLVYRDSSSARVNTLKSLNSNIKVVWTFDWNAAVGISGIPNEWILKDVNGNPIKIYGTPGWPMMNMSKWGPRANGPYGNQTYREFVATHFERTADISVFDGWGTDGAWGRDNMKWAYNRTSNPDFSQVDANNNGINDHTEFTETEWLDNWQAGMDELVANVRAKLDAAGQDKLLIINSGSTHRWSWPETNGIIIEKQYAYFDDEFNRRYWSDFSASGRKPLYSVADGLPDGKAPNLPPNTKNDFRGMRFGLVTSMFNDVYYSFQSSEAGEHYWSYWYDEFDANLGKPLSGPQQIRPGLWVRFFDNGVAIASTNGQSQTVSDADLRSFSEYNGPYYRFSGGQNPSFNNGTQFDSVTLQGDLIDSMRRLGDGILLFNKPTVVVSDIIIDNTDMGTSPSNVPATLSGFTQVGCNAGTPGVSDFYTVRCGWNQGSYGYAESTVSGSTAEYVPQIGVPGTYNIYEWHGKRNTGGTACSNVQVSVVGNAVCTIDSSINQTINSGQWNKIGTCDFKTGNSTKIVLTAPGGCTAQADAFKFEYIP